MQLSSSVLLGTLSLCAALSAQSVSSVPALNDNTIYSESGTLSNGAVDVFLCGTNGTADIRRGLVLFDVASMIPSGAVVLSASVELTLDRTSVSQPTAVALHRATIDWGEAGSNSGHGGPGANPGVGAMAQPGDATWTMRFFPSTPWTNPGGDFVATPSATAMVSSTSGRVSWSSAQLTADVQGWVDGSMSNFGYVLRGNESANFNGMSFRSHENATVSDRPALIVTWAPAAAETSLGTGCSSTTGGPLVLSSNGLPVVPTPGYALSLAGGPAGAPHAYFAFLAALSAPFPLGGGCDIQGDPTTLVATVVTNGPMSAPIPMDTSLYGLQLVFQGLAVDVPASRLVTSNGLLETLGL